MSNYKNHPYYTHQPYFIEILKQTSGNILELGCGEGSTHMIKEQIRGTGRKLVSLESNLQWLNKYTHLADDFHALHHVNADNNDTIATGNVWVDFIREKQLNDFEIVFVDSIPWSSIKTCFDYFLDKAKIIIFHDFDYFSINNIIGTSTGIQKSYHNNQLQQRSTCNLDGVVKHYRLYYPPPNCFPGHTGPPTLVCSNIMEEAEFNAMIATMESNIASYYQ